MTGAIVPPVPARGDSFEQSVEVPCFDGPGFIVLEELRPGNRISRTSYPHRGENRDSDGVGNVVPLPQGAVTAIARERDNKAEDESAYRTDQPEGNQPPGQARAFRWAGRLENSRRLVG